MALPMSAGRGVTQVVDRCEAAKVSGFLDLSSCGLMYIADAIYLVLKGHQVTKISLRNNSLKKFPKKIIAKFPNTTIFNIEGNEISEFPEDFATWTYMKGINAANNKLTTFPEGIYSMRELTILDLSGNQIEEIDVDRLYFSCSSLLQLNLSGNPLTENVKSQLLNSCKKIPKLIIRVN